MKDLQYFPFERNHYYYGKFLSADDLNMEQKYCNDKHRFVNRFLHGSGVIFGLHVMATDEKVLAIQPGAALDFSGRELIVDQPILMALGSVEGYRCVSGTAVFYLCMEYEEYPRKNENALSAAYQNQPYDSLMEGYRFYLTGTAPNSCESMVRQFYLRAERIYEDENFRITQRFPILVKSGDTAELRVQIKQKKISSAVRFSYTLRLTGLKYRESAEIPIRYDSLQTPPEHGETELTYSLRVLHGTDGEEVLLEVDGESFACGQEKRHDGAFRTCIMRAELTGGVYAEALLQKFRREGMQYIGQDQIQRPPICLARIITEDGRLSEVHAMPMRQYVYSDLDAQLLHLLHRDTESVSQNAANKQTDSVPPEEEKILSQYAVASGVAEISMPMGGRVGQCFYSEPISHGLGIGQTSVTLGMRTSESAIVYGDTTVFPEEKKTVQGVLAAKLDTEKGEFVIGLRLTDATALTKVAIHWTAVHSHNAEVAEHSPRIMIQPSMVELQVMKSVLFEVKFENLLAQPIQWEIREGAQGGVISGGGVYTAPNTPGVYQIRAKTNTIPPLEASAFVVVRNL